MADKDIKNACKDAMAKAEPLDPAPVWVPPALGGSPVVAKIPSADLLNIEHNLRRISREADPIGFLMAVMMGIPVPCFKILPDGTLDSKLETASLTQRTAIAKFLGDKVVPKMSVELTNKPKDDPHSWAAMVGNAAEAQTTIIPEEEDE